MVDLALVEVLCEGHSEAGVTDYYGVVLSFTPWACMRALLDSC